MVWQEGEGGSSSVGGEGGMFGFALLPPVLTMLPLLPIPLAVSLSRLTVEHNVIGEISLVSMFDWGD